MKKILVLGAGLVTRPPVRYLLDQPGVHVTVASRTVAKAEALIGGRPNGRAIAWTVDQLPRLQEMVGEVDLAISLLPAAYHTEVAKACIAHGKPMVTTSYVSPEMQALDEAAAQAGVLLLNEVGVDPGTDHMSAMRVIHAVEREGGTVVSFKSYCGGIPAPDSNDNPWGYKFSWSPRAVLLAGRNPGKYLENGEVVDIPGPELFAHHHTLRVEGVGEFEAYTNRDCLGYIDLYGLKGVKTMFRGTLRWPGWCETLLQVAKLGLTDDSARSWPAGMTMADYTRTFIKNGGSGNVKKDLASFLGLDETSGPITWFEWLGLFGSEPVPIRDGSSLDVLGAVMLAKMSYKPGERDMIIMQHEFIAEYPDKPS
ncbi:MAG: saccharopine dehydrogenase NADP-binding domain-containing protein, partial [Phycisphaerales bacterium]